MCHILASSIWLPVLSCNVSSYVECKLPRQGILSILESLKYELGRTEHLETQALQR